MQRQPLPSRQSNYLDITASFVLQEVERQLEQLPQRVQSYIRPDQVTILTLDHLPPLDPPARCSSSDKVWQYQDQLIKHKLRAQVAKAVQQALVTVRYTVFMRLPKQEKILYLESWLEDYDALAVSIGVSAL